MNWSYKFRTQNVESLEIITKTDSVEMVINVERGRIGVEKVYKL